MDAPALREALRPAIEKYPDEGTREERLMDWSVQVVGPAGVPAGLAACRSKFGIDAATWEGIGFFENLWMYLSVTGSA